jgi:hypothetical protein
MFSLSLQCPQTVDLRNPHACTVVRRTLLRAYLQGTSIAEGEGPGFLASVLVDSIKVDRSFLLGLSARQKRNA